MLQGVDCELMMETSGHGAMRSNYYLDDGSHLALTAIVAFVRGKLKSGGEFACQSWMDRVLLRKHPPPLPLCSNSFP